PSPPLLGGRGAGGEGGELLFPLTPTPLPRVRGRGAFASWCPMADKAYVWRCYPWLLVLSLVGLDYFSTLAYLPSIAVAAAGALAPIAALGVSLVTLVAA